MLRSLSLICKIGICFFLIQGCVNGNQKNKTTDSRNNLPVVDLTKDYTEKEFIADEENKKFIPLETSDQVLAGQYFSVKYLSDQRIVGVNGQLGDIFIFDGDGKIISYFNHKGNSNREYVSVMYPVFDEKNMELFIVDVPKRRCLAYSEEGGFLRYFDFPEGFGIGALIDFDDQTLLAYNRYHEGQDADDIHRKMPYLFLSKKDGSIVSHLDLAFPERRSEMIKAGDRSYPISGAFAGSSIVKIGKEIIIADISTDTVFLLSQDKTLTPLFVRKPSYIQGDKLVMMSIVFKTESYLFIYSQTDDLNEMVKLFSGGGSRTLPPIRMLALDLHTDQLYNVKGALIANCIDVHGKATVNWSDAFNLKRRLENGRLAGKLKQIAENIDEDDNPVVEITKY